MKKPKAVVGPKAFMTSYLLDGFIQNSIEVDKFGVSTNYEHIQCYGIYGISDFFFLGLEFCDMRIMKCRGMARENSLMELTSE